MKLIDFPGDFRGKKIQVAAEYLELALEIHNIKHSALREKDFLKKNPYGKIPVLETNEGFIYESNAILRHLARTRKELGLYGSSVHEEALVDQWLEVCSLELEPAILALALPILGWAPALGDREAIWADINRNLEILNNHLKFKTFLVGEKVSIADIAVASVLYLGYVFVFEKEVREKFPHATRWFSLINEQKPFNHVFGKAKFCQKEFPVAQVEAEVKPQKEKKEAKEKNAEAGKEEHKKEGDKKEEHKKPEQKKQEHNKQDAKKEQKQQPEGKQLEKKGAKPEAKKQEKPKEKKEEAEDDGEEKAEKKKNPLDCLPASPFNFYDFKTLYVNATDKKDALKVFWEQFDPQGYSIWFVKYQKAQGEGKNLIHTNNLLSGFLTRLEDFRKYSFAVHGVYGDEPNLELRGCWVWRGVDHPAEFKDLPNYEYLTIERCDIKNEEHRKLVENYWTGLNEGDVVEGLKAQTIKYFK